MILRSGGSADTVPPRVGSPAVAASRRSTGSLAGPGLARLLRCGAILPVLLLVLPGTASGQDAEERRYAAEKTLGCDFAFAVFAPASGEPRAVRRCPRSDAGPLYFAELPVLDLTHVDSVAAAPADPRSWRVEVRWTKEGARRLGAAASEGPSGPVGVVLDGRVVSRFTLRSGVRSDRMVVLAGVSESRARRIARRLRTEARRAAARRNGGLWRLLWHPRPGGALDSAYRDARDRLLKECGGDPGACFRDRHEPRDVLSDSVRAEPMADAPVRGVLAARLGVYAPVDGEGDPGSLGYELVFRARGSGRESVLRRLGDWGYGIHWYVRARQGGWVPIPGTRGWLDTDGGPVRGRVTSAQGDFVTLVEPVTARRAERADVVRLPAGPYVVLRVGDGTVWLRPLQSSDMSCGDGEPPSAGKERAALLVAVDALFRPDGTSRLVPSCPRGH